MPFFFFLVFKIESINVSWRGFMALLYNIYSDICRNYKWKQKKKSIFFFFKTEIQSFTYEGIPDVYW